MRFKTVFLCTLLCFGALIAPVAPKPVVMFANQQLVPYEGEVTHLFTHCLIAYPEIAFAKDNYMRRDYDHDCLTGSEFSKILKSLYDNNFILVRMSDTYEVKNERASKKQLQLPKGKKPLVLSFDDVNYDTKKLHRGMVDKIIVDVFGNLASYTSNPPDGQHIAYDKEFINILNNFILEYPDFSFNGAKGLLCLTGYDGILGYRTDLVGIDRAQEIVRATRVVEALKKDGWEFASHSYGHYHMSSVSEGTFAREIERWQQEVEPLIGKTDIYVYPYGEYEIASSQGVKTAKHIMLEKAGFKVFCGVGAKHFFGYVPFHIPKFERVLFIDRKPLDGNNLRKKHPEYNALFDSRAVYDHSARTVPFE